MKLLLLVALVGAASSLPYSNSENDQQLRYKFVSQVLSGIPELDSHYSGFRLSGHLITQSYSYQRKIFQLQNLKFVNFNGKLELPTYSIYDWNSNDYVEQEVPTEMKHFLQTPFTVIYDTDGSIKEIQSESSDPVVVTNIKKSIVLGHDYVWLKQENQMSVTNMIERNYQDEMVPRTTFRQMEKTLLGDCEVLYSINQKPEHEVQERITETNIINICKEKEYYEVVRNVNFQNCKRRPIYQRSVGASSKSDKSNGATSPYAKEAFEARTIWCGSKTETPIIVKHLSGQQLEINGNGKFESQEFIQVNSDLDIELIKLEPRARLQDLQKKQTNEDIMYNYPDGEFWTSTKSGRSSSHNQHSHNHHFLPHPDLKSAPINLYPSHGSSEEAKNTFVEAFVKMIEISKQSPESTVRQEDVVNQSASLSLFASSMSYEDIKDVWSRSHERLKASLQYKETALNVFCDILSMASTNPSVKFISEKIKKEHLKGDSAAWIAANMIRAVRTPTEEVIEELTDLLKHENVQQQRALRATIAMTLTELVHKACIDETSAEFNFPSQVYGRFCTEKSRILRKVLIPFLKQKVSTLSQEMEREQPSSSDMNNMITYINAIGNIGTDEASETLLDIIEGKITKHSHPRSLAVYKLIRAAARNPSKYRPVIMALITNTAEDEEVRMAAITALVYCQPSAADLKQISVMTWFDTSRQVVSYISSTLKSLKELPYESFEKQHHLSSKAEEALRIAKPFDQGLHKSQNRKIQQFMDKLKASVGLKLQYVNSEESAIPRNMYLKSEIDSEVQTTNQLESSMYVQGAEQVLENVLNLYKQMFEERQETRQVEEKLSYKPRKSPVPEAHVTLKMYDMQRLFTIDNRFLQELMHQISSEMSQENESNGIKRDYLKILDFSNYMSIIPTTVGMPLYIKHVTPLVISSHTSIIMGRNQVLEVKTKPVVNYMQQTSVGTFCPITKKYFGTGVEHSMHVSVPLRAELGYQDGQISVNLRTPEDYESQKNKPIFEHKVHPYTIRSEIYAPLKEQKKQMKTIYAEEQTIKKEYLLGQQIGIDLNAKVESDRKAFDFALLFNEVMRHKPLTLLSLPLPFSSVRSYRVSLYYRPSLSQTKEVSFVFSLGHGSKLTETENPIMKFPIINHKHELESQCRMEVNKGKWVEERQDNLFENEVNYRKIIQERGIMNNLVSQEMQMTDIEHVRCMKEKSCQIEKIQCEKDLKEQSRPSQEIEWTCTKRIEQCKQKHRTIKSTKNILERLLVGTATTFGASVTLKDEHQVARKINVELTVGYSKISNKSPSKTEVDLKFSFQPTNENDLYDITVRASQKMDQPTSKWDMQSLLHQQLKGFLYMQLDYGRRGQLQESIIVDVKSSQSERQKQFSKESTESKMCNRDRQNGYFLTKECKQTRSVASSLDLHHVSLTVPKMIVRNQFVKTASNMVEALLIPFTNFDNLLRSQMQNINQEQMKLDVIVQVHPEGQQLSMTLKSENEQVQFENIRIPKQLQGYLPLNMKDDKFKTLLQKLTALKAPSTCSFEKSKVTTFDNLEYEYDPHGCEQVLFKDCSEVSKVEVTSQRKSSSNNVKVTIDGQVYEIEIPQESYKATIKVNGQEKRFVSGQEYQQDESQFVAQELNYYNDKNTYITSYKDGVYVIKSQLYGLSVVCDHKRVEVQSYQFILRNKACGLCGDLNGEKTADLKTTHQCIRSSPTLAAYSYMIKDSSCQGVPSKYQEDLRREEQNCIRKETVMTPISKALENKEVVIKKHLVEEKETKLCFSKQQVKVCHSQSKPKEIQQIQVEFFCISKDSQGYIMKRMADRGEKLESSRYHPTSFQRMASQPIKC